MAQLKSRIRKMQRTPTYSELESKEAIGSIGKRLGAVVRGINLDRTVLTLPQPKNPTVTTLAGNVLLRWDELDEEFLASVDGARIWRADSSLDSNTEFGINSNKRVLVHLVRATAYLDAAATAETYIYWIEWKNKDGIFSSPSSGITWVAEPAGDPIVTDPPLEWTDFTDTSRWIQVGSVEVTKTVAASGLTLATKSAIATFGFFSGIALRGRIYGDAADGEITIEHTWDSYVRPSDLSLGQTCVWGMEMSFGSVAERGILSAYGGQGTTTADDKLTNTILSSAGGFASFADFGTAPSTPSDASFVITNKIRHANGGFTNMAFDFAEALISATVPYNLGGAMGSSRRTVTFGPPSGVTLRFGVFGDRRSALGTARLTKVKLIKGQFLAF